MLLAHLLLLLYLILQLLLHSLLLLLTSVKLSGVRGTIHFQLQELKC
jgi:hypothetical protein